MQLIFCLSKIAAVFKVTVEYSAPFFRVLQIFLILVEASVIILLIKLIQEVAPTAHARKIVIIGLALNPIAVFLTCQHCNFDVIVALWLLLFMNSLLQYNRANNPIDWLSACLFLGLGILTKTVPLLLIPMLAGGFRQAAASVRFLGGILLLGPVTLGMSIIYVLAPAGVTHNVLLYRSQSGNFGISGLFHMAGFDMYMNVPTIIFYVLLLAIMTISWIFFWRRHSMGSRETVLYPAILLALIPGLGPGYAPQYIYWFMPFLVATYAFYKGQWRMVLIGFAVICVCTYLVEYALLPEYGWSLVYLFDPKLVSGQLPLTLPPLIKFSLIENLDSETGHTLLRLPIFIAYLILLSVGVRTLFRNIPNLPQIRVINGFYPLAILALLGLILGELGVGNSAKPEPENGNKTDGSALQTDRVTKEQMETTIALNDLAWSLATSSDYRIRDGALAVELAQRACEQTHYRVTLMICTLAAAYAEAGRFNEAISTQQKASVQAYKFGETNLLKKCEKLVALYQAHQPYREAPSHTDNSFSH